MISKNKAVNKALFVRFRCCVLADVLQHLIHQVAGIVKTLSRLPDDIKAVAVPGVPME